MSSLTAPRKKLIAALAVHGEVTSPEGRASAELARLADYSPENANAIPMLLRKMAADGLITREVHGKRTMRIALVEPPGDPRYQAIIDEARKEATEAEEGEDEGPLARLQAVQARIDGEAPEPDQEPEPEPEPAPAAVDYDELAVHLLNQVGVVLGQDKRYVEQRVGQLELNLQKAREALAEARQRAQDLKVRCDVAEDENRVLKAQNADLRRQVRERDDHISVLNQDHGKIAARAISEHSRRELERTITEAPRVPAHA